jgi:hypothetical protein
MTRLGRKPQGAELVEQLVGSEHAKARLKLFLQTLSDELSVGDACRQLGISESRFYDQRNAWLHGSVEFLEPRSAGRPCQEEPTISPAELRALRQRVQELEARAAAVEVQAELLRTLPQVVARAAHQKKVPSPALSPRSHQHPK